MFYFCNSLVHFLDKKTAISVKMGGRGKSYFFCYLENNQIDKYSILQLWNILFILFSEYRKMHVSFRVCFEVHEE